MKNHFMSRVGFALIACTALLGAAACGIITGAETAGNDEQTLIGPYAAVNEGLRISLPETASRSAQGAVAGAELSKWNFIEVVAQSNETPAKYYAASATKQSGSLYLAVPPSASITYKVLVLLGYREETAAGTINTLLAAGVGSANAAGYTVTRTAVTTAIIQALNPVKFQFEFLAISGPASFAAAAPFDRDGNNNVPIPVAEVPFWVNVTLDSDFVSTLSGLEGGSTFTIRNNSLSVNLLSDTRYTSGMEIFPHKIPASGTDVTAEDATEKKVAAAGDKIGHYITGGLPSYFVAGGLPENKYTVHCKLDEYYAYGLASSTKRTDDTAVHTPFIKWTIRNGLTDEIEMPGVDGLWIVSTGGAVPIIVGDGDPNVSDSDGGFQIILGN
jgi:hypothetical protein